MVSSHFSLSCIICLAHLPGSYACVFALISSYNPFASPVNRPKVSKPSKPAPVVKVSEPSHEPASSIEEEFHPKKETEDSMEIDEFQSQDLIDDLPPTQNIEEGEKIILH